MASAEAAPSPGAAQVVAAAADDADLDNAVMALAGVGAEASVALGVARRTEEPWREALREALGSDSVRMPQGRRAHALAAAAAAPFGDLHCVSLGHQDTQVGTLPMPCCDGGRAPVAIAAACAAGSTDDVRGGKFCR